MSPSEQLLTDRWQKNSYINVYIAEEVPFKMYWVSFLGSQKIRFRWRPNKRKRRYQCTQPRSVSCPSPDLPPLKCGYPDFIWWFAAPQQCSITRVSVASARWPYMEQRGYNSILHSHGRTAAGLYYEWSGSFNLSILFLWFWSPHKLNSVWVI